MIGLVQGYIPYEKIEQKLAGKNKLLAALFALFFAFITPFCSCSTIPFVVNMLRNKIPFSIVMVFLFASPVLDPTILTIMGVILGWKVTIIYIIITASLSLIIGVALEAFGFERSVKNVMVSGFEAKSKKFDFRSALQETMSLMKTVFPYLLAGAAIGAVMAMMISSAGASLPEVILLKSIFKKELVIAFVLSVISMSTISGFVFYLL